MHRNGMTMFHHGIDYFFVTQQTRRTDKLIRNIAVTMMRGNGHANVCTPDITESTIQFIRWRLRPAILERHETSTGRTYYNIVAEDGTVSGCTLNQDLKIYELEV